MIQYAVSFGDRLWTNAYGGIQLFEDEDTARAYLRIFHKNDTEAAVVKLTIDSPELSG